MKEKNGKTEPRVMMVIEKKVGRGGERGRKGAQVVVFVMKEELTAVVVGC